MPRGGRQRFVRQGPEPIFKKRFVSLTNTTLANSVPTVLGEIQIKESCTVYSLKIDIYGVLISATLAEIMECRGIKSPPL